MEISNLEIPDAFDFNRMLKILPKAITRRQFAYFVNNAVRKGELVRIVRGKYAKKSANPFKIALFLFHGYIGFSSALYLLGLKEEIERVIYVGTSRNSPRVRFLNKEIVPVNLSALLYGTQFINGLVVSTYAKTIFDMFYRPKYASFFDLYRALNRKSLSREEWKELLHYCTKSNVSTIRRIGYALEEKAPKWFTGALLRISDEHGGVSYFMRKGSKGKFSKKWHLYDDIDVLRWKNAE